MPPTSIQNAARSVAPQMIFVNLPSASAVDGFVERALAHGGTDNNKTQEMGDVMYGRSVCDPDGNVLEIMWMDVEAAMAAWGQAA